MSAQLARGGAAFALLAVVALWATAPANAATYVLRPDGTVSNVWTVTPSGSTAQVVLDDAVLQPTAPSTATDYLTVTGNGPKVAEVTVGTQALAPGDTVTSTTAWAYVATGSGRTVTLELLTGTTSLATSTIPAGAAASWRSVATSTALTQAQLDNLRIRFTLNGTGSSTATFAYAAYMSVLTAGVLSATTATSPSFSVALDGTDKTPSYTLPIHVADTRNTSSGWNLSATTTQFTTGGATPSTLPTNASTTTGVTTSCAVAPCISPTNTVSYPVSLIAGGAAAKIFTAASGTGTGEHTITPTVQVAVPASTTAGSYTSTLTVTVANGP